MNKPVILTGLRANNDLHIGHVFGAMYPIIDLAKKHAGEYQINMFIPDLHSFTTPIDHSKLAEQTLNNLRIFVAAGLPLDNPHVHIYRQSYIPAHSELTLILNSFTGFGEMSRMTQFKDKSARLNADRVSIGLFDYPVLMAADILLYGATYIPVGDDQTQHIEFTRDIGMRMNAQFGELFSVPKPVKEQRAFFGKEQGLRIKDLADPSKKMSKSDETGKGVVFLNDTPEVVKNKIMSATTDSVGKVAHDYDKQPGISNLLDMLKLFGGDPGEFVGNNQYGPLKETTAGLAAEFISSFQTKLAKVSDEEIHSKLLVSEAVMNKQANQVLLKVQKAVGLRA